MIDFSNNPNSADAATPPMAGNATMALVCSRGLWAPKGKKPGAGLDHFADRCKTRFGDRIETACVNHDDSLSAVIGMLRTFNPTYIVHMSSSLGATVGLQRFAFYCLGLGRVVDLASIADGVEPGKANYLITQFKPIHSPIPIPLNILKVYACRTLNHTLGAPRGRTVDLKDARIDWWREFDRDSKWTHGTIDECTEWHGQTFEEIERMLS